MKKIFLLLLLVSFFFQQSNAQKAKQLLEKAKALVEVNKTDSALLILKEVKEIDSLNYVAITMIAEIYFVQEKWEECYGTLSYGINFYPDSADLFFYRASLLYKTVNTDAAIADYTATLKLANDDTLIRRCLLNRGACYSQKRAFQQAYEDYFKANLIDSNNIDVLNNMATALDELGRSDEAISILNKIIIIDSSYIGPYVNLGYQYTKLGKYAEALRYFDKALLIDKEEPLALNNRGLTKYYLKDYTGAVADIEASIKIYPSNSYAFKNRALVYLALKQTDKACADLQKALDLAFTQMYGNEVLELKKANCDTRN